jgi:hypothetical protein
MQAYWPAMQTIYLSVVLLSYMGFGGFLFPLLTTDVYIWLLADRC